MDAHQPGGYEWPLVEGQKIPNFFQSLKLGTKFWAGGAVKHAVLIDE